MNEINKLGHQLWDKLRGIKPEGQGTTAGKADAPSVKGKTDTVGGAILDPEKVASNKPSSFLKPLLQRRVSDATAAPTAGATKQVSQSFFSRLFSAAPPKDKLADCTERLAKLEPEIDANMKEATLLKGKGNINIPDLKRNYGMHLFSKEARNQARFNRNGNRLANNANDLRRVVNELEKLKHKETDGSKIKAINGLIESAQGKLNEVAQELGQHIQAHHQAFAQRIALEKVMSNARDTEHSSRPEPTSPAAGATKTAAPAPVATNTLELLQKVMKGEKLKPSEYTDLSRATEKLRSMQTKLDAKPETGYLINAKETADGTIGTSGLTQSQIVTPTDYQNAIAYLDGLKNELESDVQKALPVYEKKATSLIGTLQKDLAKQDPVSPSAAATTKISADLKNLRALVDEIRGMSPHGLALLQTIKVKLPPITPLNLTDEARSDYNRLTNAYMLGIIDDLEPSLVLTDDQTKAFDELKQKIIQNETFSVTEYKGLMGVKEKLLEIKSLKDSYRTPINEFFDKAHVPAEIRIENSDKVKKTDAVAKSSTLDETQVAQLKAFRDKIVKSEAFTPEEYKSLVALREHLTKLRNSLTVSTALLPSGVSQIELNSVISFLKTPNERKMDAFQNYLLNTDGTPKVITEGIFRLSGSSDEVKTLKTKMADADFESLEGKTKDPNVVAALMKDFLRNFEFFPDNDSYKEYLSACKEFAETKTDATSKKIGDAINKLPPENKAILKQALGVLAAYAKLTDIENTTKMDAKNLAVVFGPNLQRRSVETMPAEVLANATPLNVGAQYLIEHVNDLT